MDQQSYRELFVDLHESTFAGSDDVNYAKAYENLLDTIDSNLDENQIELVVGDYLRQVADKSEELPTWMSEEIDSQLSAIRSVSNDLSFDPPISTQELDQELQATLNNIQSEIDTTTPELEEAFSSITSSLNNDERTASQQADLEQEMQSYIEQAALEVSPDDIYLQRLIQDAELTPIEPVELDTNIENVNDLEAKSLDLENLEAFAKEPQPQTLEPEVGSMNGHLATGERASADLESLQNLSQEPVENDLSREKRELEERTQARNERRALRDDPYRGLDVKAHNEGWEKESLRAREQNIEPYLIEPDIDEYEIGL